MELRMAEMESRFADILWANAPLTTKEMVALANQELNWARTTTYTVLRKVCQRGIFEMQNGVVTTLIPKDEYHAIRSEQFVKKDFQGSLPAFIAAFTSRKQISPEDLAELKRLIDAMDN